MSEWKECKLGDVITLQRGHDLTKSKMMNGTIPVAGSNGIIGHHNEATTSAPGITIGRSGNLGNAYFYKVDFWAHNTTLYVKDFKGNNELFIYYFLKTFNFKQFNVGSAVPTLNRNHIHPLDVIIPPLPEQKAIASVLSSLDDKIDLLHRQNKTLEAMAETLFRQWFVEEAQEGWKEGKLGEIISISSGKGLKKKEYVKNGPYPVLGANGEIGRTDKCLFDEKLIFTGRVGTLGKIFISTGKVWLSDNTLIIKPKEDFFYFIYFLLKNVKLEEYNVGSTQPLIRQSDIKETEILFPKKEQLCNFEAETDLFFKKIQDNQLQIRIIEQLRDTLLPNLMSGKVRMEL
jgi:type I restriction enzyme S subunit